MTNPNYQIGLTWAIRGRHITTGTSAEPMRAIFWRLSHGSLEVYHSIQVARRLISRGLLREVIDELGSLYWRK